jgi:hypothetical protein
LNRKAGSLLAAGMMLAPGSAFADGLLDRCVDAHTQAQSLRRDGKLNAARDRLKVCADARCPILVRADCTQLFDDLDRALPTVVFDAKDETGADLTEVHVQLDGQAFADRLDGIALAADPGEHTFTFEAAGRPPVTQRLVLREGEKGRRERVVLGASSLAPKALSAAVAPSAAPSPPSGPEAIGGQRWFALSAAAAGLVGLGTSITLALLAKSKSDDANALCPNDVCPTAQAVNMSRDAVSLGNAATVALIAGAASTGAAALLWLTAKPSASRASAGVAVGAGGLVVRGSWR